MTHCVGIVYENNEVATLVGFDEAGNAKFDLTDKHEPLFFPTEAAAAAMSIHLTRLSGFEHTIIIYEDS